MFDVIVYGATGDAGRCVCHFLHNKGALIGITSWAPAARNLEKVAKLLGPVADGTAKQTKDGVLSSGAIRADAGDYNSLLAMANQAKCVIACAGPFTTMGENVVKACIEVGTDYVDITGETPWVDLMTKKYGQEAKEKGLFLCSQAAYDSVPSDIVTALNAEALAEKGETLVASETHHVVKGGAVPVGTLNTVVTILLQVRGKALRAIGMGGAAKEEKKPSKQDIDQRKALKGKPGLLSKESKKAAARDVQRNYLNPYSGYSNSVSIPHFMTSANTPIVHFTADALGYGGKGFTYRERLGGDPRKKGLLSGALRFGILVFGLILLGIVGTPLFLIFPGMISGAMKMANNADPGGVKKNIFANLFNGFKENGLTRVLGLGYSKSGKYSAETTFSSNYDAGLGFTALSISTVAAALIQKRADGEEGHGFASAVVAVGTQDLKSLYEDAGVKIETKVVTN